MACPQTADCVANTTIAVDEFLFTNAEFPDNGEIFTPGTAEVPNFSVQRGNDGSIKSINGAGYVLGQSSLRLNPCTDVYLDIYTAWINGRRCFDSIVINNPCCPAPQVYSDVTIVNMERAGVSIDDTYSSVSFEGKLVS